MFPVALVILLLWLPPWFFLIVIEKFFGHARDRKWSHGWECFLQSLGEEPDENQ
jgi:hypothetical protein